MFEHGLHLVFKSAESSFKPLTSFDSDDKDCSQHSLPPHARMLAPPISSTGVSYECTECDQLQPESASFLVLAGVDVLCNCFNTVLPKYVPLLSEVNGSLP